MIRMIYTIRQTDKHFQRYWLQTRPKMAFLKSWPGKMRLGRISSVLSYGERDAMPHIKAQPRTQALSSGEGKTLVGAGHVNPQILGINYKFR